jgi:putative hemolysin
VAGVLLAEGQLHWGWNVLLLLTVPALVALNGLFVAAEFALVAVRRTRVEEMQRQGVAGANSVATACRRQPRGPGRYNREQE